MQEQKYKNLKRYDIPEHAHELTFTCFRKQKLLQPDWTKQILSEAVVKAKENHQFYVWAYVIMANHTHLLIKPAEEEYSMAEICRSIKQAASRSVIFNIKSEYPEKLHLLETGQKSPKHRFWMPGGGYDRNICKWKTLRNVIRYIHNNPVRAGMVENPEEWKWSSAGDWLCQKKGPIPVDKDTVG